MIKIERYKEVVVRCFHNSKRCGHKETYKNIFPIDLEEKLNQLAEKGWAKFQVIINGNKQGCVLIDKNPVLQGGVQKSQKTPVGLVVNNGESPAEAGKSLNSANFEPIREVECPAEFEPISSDEVALQLSKAKDWKILGIEHREKINKEK